MLRAKRQFKKYSERKPTRTKQLFSHIKNMSGVSLVVLFVILFTILQFFVYSGVAPKVEFKDQQAMLLLRQWQGYEVTNHWLTVTYIYLWFWCMILVQDEKKVQGKLMQGSRR